MRIYAAAASVAGARRGSNALIDSGVGALFLTCAIMTVASGIIVHAFIVNDYSIKYVEHYSDAVQPIFYRLRWTGGLDGSIMFWVFLLSIFGSVAVAINRERHRELIPYVVAIISIVEAFFLFLMVIHRNPFDTYLTQAPAEGRGLTRLQNPYMATTCCRSHGLRRDDHPVRVRHGRAHHRLPRRRVAAGRAAVDDGELAVPDVGLTLGMIGPTTSSAGAATGRGIRSRTRRSCRGSSGPRSCTR